MKVLKTILIVIILSGFGFILYRSLNEKDKRNYTTVALENRDISETIFIPGNVYPAKEIEIKSQLSGILESISVKIGDYVDVGTPIASVKLVPGASDIERLENNVNIAKIDFDSRTIDFERAKRLFSTNTISKVEMDEYTRIYKLSEENLTSAKNQLDIQKKGRVVSKNISNIVISSTIGTVIDIPFEVGASIIERNTYNPGTTVAIVAETDLFKFRTLIAEHYLEHVSVEDTVEIKFNAYEDLVTKAIITKISSKGNSENGIMKYLLDAEFEITKDMPVIRSGYSATAEIVLKRHDHVLSIEEKHLVYQKDSTFLYILDADNKKIKKQVDLGISDGVYTEILNGVSIDDKIITNHDMFD